MSFDWRYTLPCKERIPEEVEESLPRWLIEITDCDLTGVRARLEERWRHVAIPLAPLRDRILGGGKPAILGLLGQTYLEMTIGALGHDKDWPWTPRKWSSPTQFYPDRAREHLAEEGILTPEAIARLSDDNVRTLVYRHLESHPRFQHYRERKGRWEWTLYIAPPVSAESIAPKLRALGFDTEGSVAQFVAAFDGLRESEPGVAGGFIPLGEWHTVEEDSLRNSDSWYDSISASEMKEWKSAVVLFHAYNGDHLLLQPSGQTGWMLHEESRVEPKWDSFERFVEDYSDVIEYRLPFDGYSPDEEAVRMRRTREESQGGQ